MRPRDAGIPHGGPRKTKRSLAEGFLIPPGIERARSRQQGKALKGKQPQGCPTFRLWGPPTLPVLAPSAPSSPIPVDLCPVVPRAAHGLFPILVLILVPAVSPGLLREGCGQTPRHCPRARLAGSGGDGGEPGQMEVWQNPPSQAWGQASPGQEGAESGQDALPPRGSLCPQPVQPEGCRRRTSVQSAGGRAELRLHLPGGGVVHALQAEGAS